MSTYLDRPFTAPYEHFSLPRTRLSAGRAHALLAGFDPGAGGAIFDVPKHG